MTILVTGATGTVGRYLVDELNRRGVKVRALTRDPAKANFPAEVEVVAGDLSKPHTLEPALEGVKGLHLITFAGDYYTPLTTAPEIAQLATKAGVQRVTILWGTEPDSTHEAVRASDFEWTVVEPVEFMSNALEWVESIRAEGVVREAFAEIPSAMVHERDIAAVAAAALTEKGHDHKRYMLTGPEELNVPEKVRILSEALGRDIEFIELTEEEARQQWRDQGQSEEAIEFLLQMADETSVEGTDVLDTVERVTGRPARTFQEWAIEHADAFRE